MSEISNPSSTTASTGKRRPVLRFLRKRWQGWRCRHQDPFNFAIHMVGIPLAFSSIVLFYYFDWYWGAAALFFGYLLQYIGHRVEGNDVGEWAGIKRLLGLPYVAISPRWSTDSSKSHS